MGYWQTKVLPQLRKVFDKSGKKAAASEFVKSFDKEEVNKELEEKKSELGPKVLEIYEAAPAEIKAVSEVVEKSGPGLVAGPIVFLLEKVGTFVPDEAPREAPAAEPEVAEASAAAVAESTTEEKKEEIEKAAEEEATPAAAEPAPAEPAETEPAKA
ncbi:Salt stress root protein RS1 [Ananas comosus]|uniref:Salt stress root protein RS1 n=1 Tax=Ananas comosus TaxID=4615 RepID=A0A199VTL8_ANACO|nr:Salt stress root protein RS1 [Ananas comosus]